MIYTVTFNPSLDYVISVPGFTVGEINRTAEEKIYPGGKGINVSLVLKNLDVPSLALGFTAGFSGTEIRRLLLQAGCNCDFIDVSEGYTRINTKISGNPETAINGQGPKIEPENLDELLSRLEKLNDGDILVLAGSIPNTLPNDVYEQILERLKGKNIRIVADATGELLLRVLKYRPFMVKPNHEELGELFGLPPLKNTDSIVECARRVQQMGAQNVLVSRGGDGAVLLDEAGEVHTSTCPKGKLVNSVGAGDSMVAGFLAGYLQSGDYNQALRLGLCAGSASAFSEWLADKASIYALLETLKKIINFQGGP